MQCLLNLNKCISYTLAVPLLGTDTQQKCTHVPQNKVKYNSIHNSISCNGQKNHKTEKRCSELDKLWYINIIGH